MLLLAASYYAHSCSEETKATFVETASHRLPKHRYSDYQGAVLVSSRSGEGILELQRKIEEVAEQLGVRSVPASWVQLHDFLCRSFGSDDEDDGTQPKPETTVAFVRAAGVAASLITGPILADTSSFRPSFDDEWMDGW